jgi:hypothetical protein
MEIIEYATVGKIVVCWKNLAQEELEASSVSYHIIYNLFYSVDPYWNPKPRRI